MFRKRHPHVGARPGTLLIDDDAVPTRVSMISYAEDWVRPLHDCTLEDLRDVPGADHVTWVDVQGFADAELLQGLAELFRIHPLAMEDIVNVPQRPKTEPYADHILIIARSIVPGDRDLHQVSMIVGRNFVITFQDQYSEQFSAIRQRIAFPTARLRRNGADYLAYAILDTVIDGYYPVLETLGERLEQLEHRVISHPHPTVLQQINTVKNQLTNLRRTMWPQRDAVQSLLSGGSHLFGDDVTMFLRDTHDHCVQTADVVEMYREMATGLLNTYMSAVAHRSNEIMKVLTIMSSIFVPLTFVAGIYGMNFENMPELSYSWSYPLVWVIMLSTATGMLLLFRRMGWIRVVPLETNEAANSPAASVGGAASYRVLDHDLGRKPARASKSHSSLRRAS